MSILAFCSSIFFASASSCAASEGWAAAGANVCPEAKGSHALNIALRNITCRFIVSNVGIGSFAWQAYRNEAAGDSLPFRRFFLDFFACLSAFKSQAIRFRGVQNKAMGAGRVHQIFPGRTQKIS